MNSVIFIGIIILVTRCVQADNGSNLGIDSLEMYQAQVCQFIFYDRAINFMILLFFFFGCKIFTKT